VRDITTGPNRSTAETRDSIVTLLCDELETGLSIRVACDLVGISMDAYYRWKKRAEQGDDEAIGLMRKLKAARAKGLKHHRGLIKRAADEGDWRAAAWLIDKLYPHLSIEEIEYTPAGAEDGKVNEWARPDAIVAIVQFAVESGLVPIEQLLAIAPTSAGRPSTTEPPAAAQLDTIRAAVVNQLADGPRELTELRDVVCALTGCSREQLERACDGLDLEQLHSPGSKAMVRLANNPVDQPRTTRAVESPEAESKSGSESSQVPATGGSQSGLQSWLNGGDRGTGDMIRERRGR
jgi:hypothetical protein